MISFMNFFHNMFFLFIIIIFTDGNSCVQLTSVGRNIGVVFSNGDVLVFDGENNHIVQLYKMEVASSYAPFSLALDT